MPIGELEDGSLLGLYAEVVESAPNASKADSVALAEAHEILLDYSTDVDEVLEALDFLVSSVEAEESLAVQIDSAVYAAVLRGVEVPPDLVHRISVFEELAPYAAMMRTCPLEDLVRLACSKTPETAKFARDTLRRGPLDRSERDRWEAALNLLPGIGADGEPADLAARVLEALEAVFDEDDF